MSMKTGVKMVVGLAVLVVVVFLLTKYNRPISEIEDGLVANSKAPGETSESSEAVGPSEDFGSKKSAGGGSDPVDGGNPPGGGGPEPTESTEPTEPTPVRSGGGGRSRSSTSATSPETAAIEVEEIVPVAQEIVIPETIKTPDGEEVKIKIAEPESRFIFTKTPTFGSEDPEIKEVQKQLKAEGLFSPEPTEYFGLITFEALKKFQEKHGIRITGIIDLITNSYLNTSRNISFPQE